MSGDDSRASSESGDRTGDRTDDRIDELWDADVLVGFWPRRQVDASLPRVRALLAAAGVVRAVVSSMGGALYDAATGNDETRAAVAADPTLIPAGTVDLRDCLDCETTLTRLQEQGVRLLRLFPALQNIPPGAPSLGYVLRQAAAHTMPVLMDGPVPQYGPSVVGSGATVVFLDLHAYHLADFVLLARQDPGVLGSTRLLTGPDSITQAVTAVGPHRLVYGSRTPLDYSAPSRFVLAAADLAPQERAAISHGNLQALVSR